MPMPTALGASMASTGSRTSLEAVSCGCASTSPKRTFGRRSSGPSTCDPSHQATPTISASTLVERTRSRSTGRWMTRCGWGVRTRSGWQTTAGRPSRLRHDGELPGPSPAAPVARTPWPASRVARCCHPSPEGPVRRGRRRCGGRGHTSTRAQPAPAARFGWGVAR